MLFNVGQLEMVNINKNNLEVLVMDEVVVNLVNINRNIVEVVFKKEKVLILDMHDGKMEISFNAITKIFRELG